MTYYIYAKAQCNNCTQYFYVTDENSISGLPAPEYLRSNFKTLAHDKKSELYLKLFSPNVTIMTLVYDKLLNQWKVGEEVCQYKDSLRTTPNESVLDNLKSILDLGLIDFHLICRCGF